jgi:thiol-disulfide isomerase/thioredoxin
VRILSLTKQIGRGAGTKLSRVAFFIALCALFFLPISCVQTKDPAQKLPSATKPPSVMQIDDEKLKQLLKPSGKPLLVNFWATWCGPYREEFPGLVKIDAEYKGKIDFITITLDFEEELTTGVPKFLQEMKAEMPTYLLTSADENTLIPSIAKDWSGALPFTILYNENGEITYSRQGKVDPETLKAEIEKKLGQTK